MRLVPFLQAAVTTLVGFSAYQRPWLSAAAACAVLAWSSWLTLRVWPAGRCLLRFGVADVTVAVLALLAVGAAVPPDSVTTSFYWTASYAAAVALMLGLSLPPCAGGSGLVALAELITGPAPAGCPPVRVQARDDGAATEIVARIPRGQHLMADPIAAAGARLALADGTAEPVAARPDEVRLRLRVPGRSG
jgi:hypothetical protein